MIADQAMAWANTVGRRKRESTTIVLSGDSGCGKTLLAKSLYDFVLEQHGNFYKHWLKFPSFQWIDWVDWCQKYQNNKGGYDFDDMCNDDILFLDDIGAEADRYKSGESTALLCQLLGKREKKYNVITTNIPRHQWAEKFDKRVADRLKRNKALYLDFWHLTSFSDS